MTRIAIIGAGLAGLVVARELEDSADIVVFEKSRGVGGRMATRYDGEFEFDHGAQFFTARSPAFQAFLKPLIDDGVVTDWRADFAEFSGDRIIASRKWDGEPPHYVGVPRMNRMARCLSNGLDVRLRRAVARCEHAGDGWQLFDMDGGTLGRFDWLVSTAPAAQTAALLPRVSSLTRLAGERRMRACYSLMLGFDSSLRLPWHAAFVGNADISWMSVNSSKPGRPEPFTLLVHSTNAWADDNIELDKDTVLALLLEEVSRVAGIDLHGASFRDVHRWRYANIDKQPGDRYFIDSAMRVAAGGDWFIRGRIEAAYTSALELAAELRRNL